MVTLPIYIGNIAVNLTPSIPHPIAQGAPMPAMPRFSPAPVVPSAPPVEDDLEGALGAGGVDSEEIPTKSHSQQDPSGVPLSMSPGAFGQASGPVTRQPAQSFDGSAPLFCLSTGATIPFFTDSNTTPVPTSCPLIMPPEYSTWEYPHGEWSSTGSCLGYYPPKSLAGLTCLFTIWEVWCLFFVNNKCVYLTLQF